MSTVNVSLVELVGALESGLLVTSPRSSDLLESRLLVSVTDGELVSVESSDRHRVSVVDVLGVQFPRPTGGQVDGRFFEAGEVETLTKRLKSLEGFQQARKGTAADVVVEVRVEPGGLSVIWQGTSLSVREAVEHIGTWPEVRRFYASTNDGCPVTVNAGALNAAVDGLSRLPDQYGEVYRPVVTLVLPDDAAKTLTVARLDLENGAPSITVECEPVPEAVRGRTIAFTPSHVRDAIRSTGLSGVLRKASVTLWLPNIPAVEGRRVTRPVRFTPGGFPARHTVRGHLVIPPQQPQPLR